MPGRSCPANANRTIRSSQHYALVRWRWTTSGPLPRRRAALGASPRRERRSVPAAWPDARRAEPADPRARPLGTAPCSRQRQLGVRPRQLLECALTGRFVRPPAHKLGAVAEAVVGDVVIAHFHHELGLKRLPFRGPRRAPAARSPRSIAGEARRCNQLFQTLGEFRLLVISDAEVKPTWWRRPPSS